MKTLFYDLIMSGVNQNDIQAYLQDVLINPRMINTFDFVISLHR